MVHVYTYAGSRSLRVVWTLEELGVEYQCHALRLDKGEGQTAEHLLRHPDGKVPVLVDGDVTVFESGAICRYLAAKYGKDGQLMPSDLEGQAQVDQWLFFVLTELEQPLWTQAKHTFALPDAQKVPAVIPTAAWEYKRAMGALERRFNGEGWLVGDAFSLADIFLAQTLGWAEKAKHPVPEQFKDYLARCAARPACARAVAREEAAAEGAS
ncbi:glutathione S-transferase family protein [Halomonas halocynthiae]|uniref:glutathione S-transferase family protein n=1 Tax=Halomonas halocynthiae TaxID=176290 RepID=UPI0003F9D289|nr:glutathione S-transferase family protein [Halomonas halocynthiae]